MSQRIYIDESKARNYLMAAAVVLPADNRATRQLVRSLLLPGQSRVHMKHEKDRRRRQILSSFAEAGITATIYDGGGAGRSQWARRAACIEAIVADANNGRGAHLVFEQDDTLLRADRECLIECLRNQQVIGLTYEHRKANQELLLVLPDAIAWAWARGGDWRRRLESIVVDVKKV